MVFDVVPVKCIPGMSHKWIKDVREERVEEKKLLFKDSSNMYVLMHQKGVSAHIRQLHDNMENPMSPCKVVK